jgi:thiol:disulfide interchange protein DsbA
MSIFKTLITLMALVLAGCASSPAVRDQDVLLDGYTLLSSSRSLPSAAPSDVIVFFHYACPHCNRLYSDHLSTWMQQNPDTRITFVPVTWNSNLVPLARAYHAGEEAKLHPRFHVALFAAQQKSTMQPRDKTFFAGIAAECCGMDAAAFEAVYESDAVQQRMLAAAEVLRTVQIDATPNILVGGKYLITPTAPGSIEKVVSLMDALRKK